MEYLLRFGHQKAKSIEQLANKLNVDSDALKRSVELYNSNVCPFEKDEEMQVSLSPPYYAMDCSIKASPYFPFPTLSLGGLVVDESSSLVKKENGAVINGLYAVGRTAIGICSENYISGLSLADCIYSGRRAARHVVKQ